MAQVDPVALRLRDLVYARIIDEYDPNLCRKYRRMYDYVGILFCVPPNRIYCEVIFYNDNVVFKYIGDYQAMYNPNTITLNLHADWTEQEFVNRIVSLILSKAHYPSRANAEYSLVPPSTLGANPDLAAVFLALRARIERLRARLQ